MKVWKAIMKKPSFALWNKDAIINLNGSCFSSSSLSSKRDASMLAACICGLEYYQLMFLMRFLFFKSKNNYSSYTLYTLYRLSVSNVVKIFFGIKPTGHDFACFIGQRFEQFIIYIYWGCLLKISKYFPYIFLC